MKHCPHCGEALSECVESEYCETPSRRAWREGLIAKVLSKKSVWAKYIKPRESK